MILDNLSQWRSYATLSPRFRPAFEFLQTFNDRTPVGRHEIDGDDVFALVQSYVSKPLSEGQFEAHRKYIDIQYVHTGRETMLWAPLAALTTVTIPYDDKKDAALFAQGPEALHVHVSAGQFTIFFPDDGHVPSRVWDQPVEVLKAVIKIRV